MADYQVTFNRIGDTNDVPAMTFEAVSDPDELAALVCHRALPYLGKTTAAVQLDVDGGIGRVLVPGPGGVGQSAGEFVIRQVK